ncbi:CTD nuclear envelope phosphatase 1 isoform X2 [Microcaecilia unicolor]|uniref:Mitochondrial import inner membrane translocase subunit TIM50 n=1 Tax=Microcaecilia unicolor TaxID=1415580 RepID=A0A6P7WUT3_9AMPH|nr:CTD nuclear envelope phosphatase 1 isoform X2 [Microcaecilia unicolor]
MMKTQCLLGLRTFVAFATKLWSFLLYILRRQIRTVIQYQTVRYDILPLSPVSRNRLAQVKRKILVLDLDETLIHSHHDGVLRPTVRPGTPPDFILKVVIDKHPVRFFVHKRPHVDFFLEVVSQWYELVVFTASMEIYGSAVADKLDNNRALHFGAGQLHQRPFGCPRRPLQHCHFGQFSRGLQESSRFTADVRSVLSRNLHQHRLW